MECADFITCTCLLVRTCICACVRTFVSVCACVCFCSLRDARPTYLESIERLEPVLTAESDATGSVELLLERGADVAELGHRPPADLDGARPRHAVALAQQAHRLLDRLQQRHGWLKGGCSVS